MNLADENPPTSSRLITAGIKCVVLDADNTLYGTKEIAKEADIAAMKVLAAKVHRQKDELYEEWIAIVKIIKKSPKPDVRHRLYSYGKICEKYGMDISQKMYEKFSEVLLDKLQIAPEASRLLASLKDKFAVYVATEENRDMAMEKLAKFGLDKQVGGIITSTDTETMKPSVKYYGAILEKFEPKEILVVGDNYQNDLELPERLGMRTFMADSPAKLVELLALFDFKSSQSKL